MSKIQISQVWTVTALSMDRYLALCRPLYHKRLITTHRVKCILWIMVGVAAAVNAPRFFEFRVFSNGTNIQVGVGGAVSLKPRQTGTLPTWHLLNMPSSCSN